MGTGREGEKKEGKPSLSPQSPFQTLFVLDNKTLSQGGL